MDEEKQKLIAETIKVMEKIERFVIQEIKAAPEDNPLLQENLGDIRMHILKLNYKHSMSSASKNRRTGDRGCRRGPTKNVGDVGERRGGGSMFGRRDTDQLPVDERRNHATIFGRRN
jgi:hypothetical protein